MLDGSFIQPGIQGTARNEKGRVAFWSWAVSRASITVGLALRFVDGWTVGTRPLSLLYLTLLCACRSHFFAPPNGQARFIPNLQSLSALEKRAMTFRPLSAFPLYIYPNANPPTSPPFPPVHLYHSLLIITPHLPLTLNGCLESV